jgi:hypothetical protein
VTVRIPAHVPWLVHRVAVSRRYSDPLATILGEWSIDDVVTANEILDALEEAEERSMREVTRG